MSSAASSGTGKRPLEFLLAKAIDPYTDTELEREQYRQCFCTQLADEIEGPGIACRLLAHKAQSPDQNEALNALTLLELCSLNSGTHMWVEIGKFKFLNELIKLLSPKYLGNQTSGHVKQKVIELLYMWKQMMPHQGKILEAYNMLKRQRIISNDPSYVDEKIAPRLEEMRQAKQAKMASFEDEEKSRILARLLSSGNPEDLQAANNLIKNLVRVEDQKLEAKCKRSSDLDVALNNSSLLTDMIGQFNADCSSAGEVQLMRELNQSLITLRKNLFAYANDTQEDAGSLAEILSVNDEVNNAIEQYRRIVEPHMHRFDLGKNNSQHSSQSNAVQSTATSQSLVNFDDKPKDENIIDSLMDLDLNKIKKEDSDDFIATKMLTNLPNTGEKDAFAAKIAEVAQERKQAKKAEKPVNPLDLLSQSLLADQVPDGVTSQMKKQMQNRPLNEIAATSTQPQDDDMLELGSPNSSANKKKYSQLTSTGTKSENINLPSLDCLDLSDRPPFVLCENNGIRVVILYGVFNGRQYLIANVTSNIKRQVSNLTLTFKCKTTQAQIATSALDRCDLPKYSPLTDQPAANLVIAYSPTTLDVIRLQYTLSFVIGDDDDVVISASVNTPLSLSS